MKEAFPYRSFSLGSIETLSAWRIGGEGQYFLGLEMPGTYNQLPAFSAHDKLELRLSLPRGFWPKTWLDEEANFP